MPTFHFEAMDSAGETDAGHLQAASADEAMRMLRMRGLFVTMLKNELAEAADDGTSFESLDRSNSASPALLWAIVAGDLASFLFGVGLFGSREKDGLQCAYSIFAYSVASSSRSRAAATTARALMS